MSMPTHGPVGTRLNRGVGGWCSLSAEIGQKHWSKNGFEVAGHEALGLHHEHWKVLEDKFARAQHCRFLVALDRVILKGKVEMGADSEHHKKIAAAILMSSSDCRRRVSAQTLNLRAIRRRNRSR